MVSTKNVPVLADAGPVGPRRTLPQRNCVLSQSESTTVERPTSSRKSSGTQADVLKAAHLECRQRRLRYNGRNRPEDISARDWLRPRWGAEFSLASILDPLWRINNIYHFIDTHGQRRVFRMKAGMFEVWSEQHVLNVLLKARQYGYTTLWLIDMLDDCIWRDNRSAQLTAHNVEDAKELFSDKAKYAWQTLEEWDDEDPIPDGIDHPGMVEFCLGIKDRVQLVRETAETLHFSNNSKLRVTTSGRSGTLQRLHVSELGKIAAKFPEKAKEIKTGSIPAAMKAVASSKGQVWIESTAEGQTGYFKELCDQAQHLEQELTTAPRLLKPTEWKFHFHAWWKDKDYVASASNMVIPPRLLDYFSLLEHKHGITLSDQQKAWYSMTESSMGGDMKREYPSTPEEAFEASVEGAWLETAMRRVREEGRILEFEIAQNHQVHTLWDIGHSDDSVIVCWQHIRMENRIVGYYEACGESFNHYKSWLDDFRNEHKISYGTHFGPHDLAQTRLMDYENTSAWARAANVGLIFDILPKPEKKTQDIDALRDWLNNCFFLKSKTQELVKHLDGYVKEWDSRHGRWRDTPAKNGHQHAADAMQLGPKAEARIGWATTRARPVTKAAMKGFVA
jgi:hypothetical protein